METQNKNRLVLLIIGALIIAGGAHAAYSVITKSQTGQQLVGNDRDAHGCIGSAGYSWDESSQKCIRSWEEAITPTPSPATSTTKIDNKNKPTPTPPAIKTVQPSITVLSPNGGEIWKLWSNNSESDYTVKFSIDNGSVGREYSVTLSLLGDGGTYSLWGHKAVAGNNSFIIHAPGRMNLNQYYPLQPGQYKLYALLANFSPCVVEGPCPNQKDILSNDDSDQTFTIVAGNVPIIISMPTDNTDVTRNSPVVVSWLGKAISPTLKVKLYRPDNSIYNASPSADLGTHIWTIPYGNTPVSGRYKVSVCDEDPSVNYCADTFIVVSN